MKYQSNRNIVFSCNYHVVFCPKYRRPVLVDGVDDRFKEIARSVADELGFEIVEMEVMPRLTACCREARMLSADSSFCVAYVEPSFRSFELSERKFGPIECGILESTEPPLNLVESSQRSSLSERVRPFAKTLGLFQLTGAARPLSFFIVSH